MRKSGLSKSVVYGAWLLMLGGLVMLAWPVATDWIRAKEAEQSIVEIMDVYDDMNDPDRLENLKQAQAWNARLRGEDPGIELWDYPIQLTYKGTPKSMMAWIDIPKISTRLPIFHGTSEDVLSAGVGHLEWSSLPVGGKGTRCVLSAHSGMQDTRMFDDIRLLEEGDQFVLWTLSEPYAYKVIKIQVIEPDEIETFNAEGTRDLCSLVTCTPFGINSHRLVVTGERCEYNGEEQTGFPATYVNRRTLPMLIGICVLLGVIVIVIISRRARRLGKGNNALEKGEAIS